jgi:hypothetical protein
MGESIWEFREMLLEKIEVAKKDCEENIDFPNSYGAGFDKGILTAYLEILEYMQECSEA